MPLNPLTLANAIREFNDPDFSGFSGFPQSKEDSALKWAEAFNKFMLEIVNPPLGVHVAGKSAMEVIMSSILLPLPPTGAIAIQSGLVSYVTAFAPTTAPFVSIPPAGPPPIVVLPPALAEQSAIQMAGIIFAWAKTGMSSVPPSPPIPWT